MKTVVYTANIGGKDTFRDPKVVNREFDYIIFTDSPRISSRFFKVIHVPVRNNDPNRTAKMFKLLPHLFFPGYQRSIWLDCNLQIRGDLRGIIEKMLGQTNIGFFRHPFVRCAYQDIRECIQRKKDSSHLLLKQRAHYKAAGMPRGAGGIDGAMIFRNHHELEVKEAMEMWWEQVSTWSRRDQSSWGYVSWKTGMEYRLIDARVKSRYVIGKDHIRQVEPIKERRYEDMLDS